VTDIPKIFLPVVDQGAVRRNPAHWPDQVAGFLACGYGGEKTRVDEERKRGGDEHAPPHYCYKLATAWCDKIDEHVAAYFLLPKGSFIDGAWDKSAKDKVQKGGAA
jgi:hypothetical protein